MYVSDYLQDACASDIGSISVGNIGGEAPDAEQSQNRAQLIVYLNLAVREIHKRFALLQKEHVFCNVQPNCYYDIPLNFLYPISAFLNNGMEVGLNNERKLSAPGDPDYWVSLLFPEPFKALVKGTWEGRQPLTPGAPYTAEQLAANSISMIYVAGPPRVEKYTDFVDLTEVFSEAIVNYMAYKAFSKLETSQQSSDNVFYMRFLSNVKQVKLDGLVPSDNLDTNLKLYQRGYP